MLNAKWLNLFISSSKCELYELQYKQQRVMYVHCVSKNVPPLVCYNSDTPERILIFGRNITDKVSNQDSLLSHLK